MHETRAYFAINKRLLLKLPNSCFTFGIFTAQFSNSKNLKLRSGVPKSGFGMFNVWGHK